MPDPGARQQAGGHPEAIPAGAVLNPTVFGPPSSAARYRKQHRFSTTFRAVFMQGRCTEPGGGGSRKDLSASTAVHLKETQMNVGLNTVRLALLLAGTGAG